MGLGVRVGISLVAGLHVGVKVEVLVRLGGHGRCERMSERSITSNSWSTSRSRPRSRSRTASRNKRMSKINSWCDNGNRRVGKSKSTRRSRSWHMIMGMGLD